jgi:DNA-binding CsgD family transcriptional regulator
VEYFAASPRPLAHGSALEDLAMAEGVADGRIEHLERALVVYSQVGASWDAARVRRRLRDLGVRRRGNAVAAEATGWEALTAAELGVALLLADGLTNREAAERLFLSPHTVNSHLRRVYAKLGVNSRGELGRLAAEREVGAADHTIG